MHLNDYDFELPSDLIAQKPIEPRDHSRLLILDKKSGEIEHGHFYDIVDLLGEGDVLVFNNSRVFPARLIGRRRETGGRLEIFLLREKSDEGEWSCLVGGRRARVGLEVDFEMGLSAVLKNNNGDGTWQASFNQKGKEMMKLVEMIGQVPLPPYIKRGEDNDGRATDKDRDTYQTVYADEDKVGSVAAPTAGFHFTPELLDMLKSKGVQMEYITLHVGLGTFAPVKVDDITKHKMHSEYVEIDARTIANIYLAKKEKRRIITVGTTSTRTLEAIVQEFPISNFQFPNNAQFPMSKFYKQFKNVSQFVNIFIYPGYEFKLVDAMITNFHLPKSTLLMLVSALAGKANIDKAYANAIREKYRFYSYGDAMFIK